MREQLSEHSLAWRVLHLCVLPLEDKGELLLEHLVGVGVRVRVRVRVRG